MEANQTYIGVDVGTTSARAAIFDHKGTMLAKSATPITVFRPKADHYEHSSEEIWKSVCSSVQNVLKKSRANVANVRGVGFDATCSLYSTQKLQTKINSLVNKAFVESGSWAK
jgi:ribulose kinase